MANQTSETVEKATYCFDLEQFSNFHSGSFKNIKTGEFRRYVIYHDLQNPKLSINQMEPMLRFIEEEVKLLIGYNNHGYDDLLLKHLFINREMFNGPGMGPETITASLKVLSNTIIDKQKFKEKVDPYIKNLKSQVKFKSWDLYRLWNTVDQVSLKQIAINLRWPNIIDLPYHPNHFVTHDQIEKILYYNDNDVNITDAVRKIKEPELQFRRDFGLLYDLKIMNSNDTNIAKATIRKFYSQYTGKKFEEYKDKRTFYREIPLSTCISPKVNFMTQKYIHLLNTIKNTKIDPTGLQNKNNIEDPNLHLKSKKEKKKQFEYILNTKYTSHTIGLGGIHSINPPEELNETEDYYYIDADATAFYPYIMVTMGLFPKHLGPEFIKAYEEYIVNNRVKVKRLWQEGIEVAANKLIDAGLKISSNSTYGLTKSIHSWLYDPHVTTYVCITGQLYLCMLMERLEEMTDCVVVYSNTDGFTTKVPKYELENYNRICQQWVEHLGINLEFVRYKKMLLRDINNYMMITHDPKKPLKQVGLFVVEKRLKQAYTYPIIAKALQEYYYKGTRVDYTIKSCTDVYEFMKAERTSTSKFNIYFHPKNSNINEKPILLQKSNRWIITNGNPNEGKIIKYNKTEKDIHGNPEATNMQKGYYMIVMNDVPKDIDITKLKIDYDFYISECFKIIKEIKVRNKQTQHSSHKQGELF